MTTLEELIDNSTTDKNTKHSYLPVYESKFQPYKNSAKFVLEIGIQRGGSIKLWHDYFKNATIVGMDIQPSEQNPPWILNNPRINLLNGCNAYDNKLIEQLKQSGAKFDIMIDDGPHTLESMVIFAKYYSRLLAPNGTLVIEDIPDPDWLEPIAISLPESLRGSVEVADLRHVKGRWDDIMMFVKAPSNYVA